MNKTVDAVDKTALDAAVQAAWQEFNASTVGRDPGQYTDASMTAFKAVIDIAAGIDNDPAYTSAQVAQAVIDLSTGTAAFEASVITEADKTSLQAAITDVQTKHDTASMRQDPGQYPQSAADALQSAIDAATLVLNNKAALTTEIAQAVSEKYSCIRNLRLHCDTRRR